MTRPISDISVIICTYTEDRWSDLVACVRSARQQIVLPREIVVVVDHNPRLLVRAQAELVGPDVLVIENRETRGLSGARNSGIAAADGSLIAFLDDDAVAVLCGLQMVFVALFISVFAGRLQPVARDGSHAAR